MSKSPQSRPPTLGKLNPPRHGRIVDRDRLFKKIDQLSTAPGLWIAGPPGIGKTTLIASYLEARSIPCVWLQLDHGDTDPATFFYFLNEAVAGIAKQRAMRLQQPGADDLRDVPGFIQRYFRQLCAALELPWALVLDNTQELGEAPWFHAGLALALAELPVQARLMIISREPPQPPYARAMAGQQLALIEANALRFDEMETRQLVLLHERDWHANTLHQTTDGWAAAMIILLAARKELNADAAINDGVARDLLFNFFAGEVMAKMPPWEAEALIRIAFLPGANEAMAIAISHEARAGRLLAGLARRSLFTELRAGVSPTYTLHALFREFLQTRADQTMDGTTLQALRLQAAHLLADNGQLDAAMVQLIAAQAWNETLSLVKDNAGALVAQGRTATVRGWIMALPESFRQNAQASYWLGCCELATHPAEALHHMEKAYAAFNAETNQRGAFEAAAAAADVVIFLGKNLDALSLWMPQLESYAPIYLNDRDQQTDLRVLPGLLGAFVHRETAHPLTRSLADLAEGSLDQPSAASQRILLGSLAYYFLWTGQTVRLERIMLKIDRMCTEQVVAPSTLFRWYGIGVLIRSLLGRVEEARDHAIRALALSDRALAPMRAKAHLLMVIAALAGRDAELARTHLEEAACVLDAQNPVDTTTYEFQRGLLMMLDHNWRSAAQLMRSAVESGRASGWPLREHIALIGHTLTLVQVGAFDEAEATLRAVTDHHFYAACRWHQWLSGLAEAYLAECQGQRPRCLIALTRAFAIGREDGFDFGPMPYCCGDMMPRLASIALEHAIDRPFAQQIIQRYRLPAPPNAGEHWPWPVQIRTLGRFRIERIDGLATASRKESRKPLDLLKLLIALGGETVPVVRLSASLWPEAPGDAARNSFDNALHRLRKLLGGDHRVQLHAGALTLDPATCWTDAAALKTCLMQLDALGPQSDPVFRLALLSQAQTLYQGEFLADEDELPDVLVARSRLQAWFNRQVSAQGAWLESNGQYALATRLYSQVMEQQPLAEETCRHLIRCLLELGQRAEAYGAYRRCRQQLSVVLGMRTAPETDALVATLRNL